MIYKVFTFNKDVHEIRLCNPEETARENGTYILYIWEDLVKAREVCNALNDAYDLGEKVGKTLKEVELTIQENLKESLGKDKKKLTYRYGTFTNDREKRVIKYYKILVGGDGKDISLPIDITMEEYNKHIHDKAMEKKEGAKH